MPDPIRRLPVRLHAFELAGEYVGWTFTARVNPPVGILDDLSSGELPRIIEGIADLIKDWNFVDEEGALMGPPTKETIRAIPSDLLNQMLTALVAEAQKLPPA